MSEPVREQARISENGKRERRSDVSQMAPEWIRCGACRAVKQSAKHFTTRPWRELTCNSCVALGASAVPDKVRGEVPDQVVQVVKVIGRAAPRTETERKANAAAVRKHREKTNDAYDRKYRKAVAQATARLKANHPQEWDRLMAEARKEAGL